MDRTLLEIFAVEQTEHVQRIRVLVDMLASLTAESSGAVLDELLRRTHTLKGASRAVGLEKTESLVHRMEAVFVKWRRQVILPDVTAGTVLHHSLDACEDILAWALGARSEPDVAPVLQGLDGVLNSGPTGVPSEVPTVHDGEATERQRSSEGGAALLTRAPPELVRVNTSLLDAIVRSASHLMHATHMTEAATERAARHAELVEQAAHEYSRLRRNCMRYVRLHGSTSEFRPVLECLEYLDRHLPRIATDTRTIATVQEQRSRSFKLLAKEVHEDAYRARMTPAQTVFGAFGAMIRELAGDEGKQIDFRADGLDVQADREVLQALKDPVMHVLRNAVSHGIEEPRERLATGKSPEGTVRLHIESRDERLVITLQDDGRGLDISALAQQAMRLGIVSESAMSAAKPDALARLIFHPGLTTSSRVTRLSGRGMGLSAVAQAISAVQGDFRVRHQAGQGTTIVLRVPLNMSTQNVLLFSQGDQVYGIPAAAVLHLYRFRPADVRVIQGQQSLVLEGKAVPVVRLADLLGTSETRKDTERTEWAKDPTYLAAILISGEDSVALVVETLIDHRESLIKDTGLPQQATGWSSGAIALEDGTVAVMLSVERLLREFHRLPFSHPESFQAGPAEAKKYRILVVDDSVTTRAMERSLLEAHGYEVRVAVDGMDAWAMIQGDLPDLVISDVSMPRMDGFQLLERIKTNQSFSRLPVILVTSLESREEQEKGLLLGADAYIVKRKFDQRELLRIVQQII